MRLLVCTVFLLWSGLAWLQPRSPYIQNFTNKVYGKKSNPEIYCVVQDTNKLLIAGTSRGVKIYNGHQWDFVGVRDGSYVTALTRSNDGQILVGAVGDFGVLQRNKKGQWKFKSYAQHLQLTEPVWRVHSIGNRQYFQTENALYVCENGKIIHTIVPETSFHLSFSVNNRLLIRQREKGIYEVKEGKLYPVDRSERVKSFGVFAAFEHKGKLKFLIRDEHSDVPWERSIYGGIKLHDGNYLINTLQDGVFLLDPNFKVINQWSKLQGITDNDVKSCYQGSDGNIWLATNNGISLIEYQSDISYYNATHGIDGDVQDIFHAGETIFVATSKGIFKEQNGLFQATNIRTASWQFVKNKEIICATSEGIYKWNGSAFLPVLRGNYNNIAFINGQYYLSGPQGIIICSAEFQIRSNIELPLNQTLEIFHDHQRNEIWVGTAVLGVVRIFADGSFDLYNDDRDGLNIAWIKPILNHDGTLAFATPDGLHRFVYEEEMIKLLPDSLRNQPELARGTFEPIGSNEEISALFRFKNKKFAVVSNEIREFKNYNYTASPYNCLDFGRINRIRLIDGFGYICTSDGLIVLERNAREMTPVFKLSMLGVEAADQPISLDQFNELPYQQNELNFSFQAPFYHHGSQVKYRYKLDGNDQKWSDWITDNHIAFGNLNEGSYTMLIQAENSLGQQSNILRYAFSIAPPWYRTWYAYTIYFILAVALVYAAVYLGRLRLKRKNEELEHIVAERTREIAHQKELIEEKHQEITDSINYAERIQAALMTSDDHWQKLSGEHFVLFRPRDVVSGDFYWAWQNEKYAIWAAADCTGHGVPGAFMSMLGIGFLNEIVIEGREYRPAAILNALREKIIRALEQNEQNNERKDGMDIALCCLHRDNNKVYFAGANNPLLFVTEDEARAETFGDDKMIKLNNRFLVTLPGDKMPVGKFVQDDKPFTERCIDVKTGDLIYTLSDGFPDQFGGHDGKKFMIKRLKQHLLQIADQDLKTQKEQLNTAFENWLREGQTEQIDDVCIVGVKMK